MELSPDAILFALELLRRRELPAAKLAGHLRGVAAGSASDHLVALQEALLDSRPELAPRLNWLGAEPPYVLFHCRGCRRMFRARTDQVGPAAYCPLCGEAVMTDRNLLLLGDWVGPARRAAEPPSPPYVLGARRRFVHFDLVGLLGRGGAGMVYEAHNRRAGRRVALKMLDFQPLESVAETFRRLRRESRVAATVVHENIVRVLDLGVAEGVPFIEMELVRGASLSERVRSVGPLQAAEACDLVVQALRGLACVHREQIVHGDVKPGNILIERNGRARLTDFGIAKFLEETTSLASASRLVGSPHFMAPEQWRGDPLSPRTDLYAMGLVLYYALTGRLPYEGRVGPALMYSHLQDPVISPDEPPPGVPERLARVISRATQKGPDSRFQTAEEMAAVVEACARGPGETD